MKVRYSDYRTSDGTRIFPVQTTDRVLPWTEGGTGVGVRITGETGGHQRTVSGSTPVLPDHRGPGDLSVGRGGEEGGRGDDGPTGTGSGM